MFWTQRKILFLSILLNLFQQSQGVRFYPFGVEAGDSSLEIEDDAFEEIDIGTEFRFFGDVFDKVYISTNGIIYFGEGSTIHAPKPYPLVGRKSVAAYWVDSDLTEGGDVFYRGTLDENILNDINLKIQHSFVEHKGFTGTWALITTFNNVPKYRCDDCSKVVNHQTILTTDGVNSFVIFLYDRLDYANAQIGFNAGDGRRFYITSKSNTLESGGQALNSSNVGRPGEWIFSIRDKIVSAFSNNNSLQIDHEKIFYHDESLVQGVEFFPFGVEAGDFTLGIADDAFEEIDIKTQFSYFGDVFDKVYISTNGIIFFGEGRTTFTPEPYPLHGTRSVAAYWVDSDTTRGGNVFYRGTFDQSVLNVISTMVQQSFVEHRRFRGTWALITTFNNVPRFKCNYCFDDIPKCTRCSQVVNHQTILTTDGVNSFVIFLYDRLDYANAQIGFNAGDGRRFYITSKSNTLESGREALNSSNVGRPGQWIFSIGDEIVSACSPKNSLQVYPNRIFYAGNQELILTGPCLETQSKIIVNFDSIPHECAVKDSNKIKCLTPYFDKLGKVNIELSIDNLKYENFITTYDFKNSMEAISEIKNLPQHENNRLTWACGEFRSTSRNRIKWFQHNMYIDDNGNVLKEEKFSRSSSSNTKFAFERDLSRGLIMNFHFSNKAGQTCELFVEMRRARTCQQWYDSERANREINLIVAREGDLNPCPPRVPESIPEVFGRFMHDTSCNPGNRACIFNPGAKVCYLSVFNPNGVSTKCCYNDANTLIIGPGGGGSINLFDPSLSHTQHLLNDLYPFLLCCKWSNNCRKYYEKRPSITFKRFTPPRRPIFVSGDPHFITLDGFEYHFNPVGEYIYLKTPQTEVQCRMTQYGSSQASYFSAFAVKTGNESIIQVELNAGKKLIAKMSSTSLDYGVYKFENMTVDFINSSTIIITTKCGVWMKINAMSGILNAIFTFEETLKGNIHGLVGNWDDDIENDLMLPNMRFLSINSSDQDIHYKFGLSWTTTADTSLFKYPALTSWADYQNELFVPFFGTPPDNPICEGDKRCLLDLHVTNNINLSLSNMVMKQENENVQRETRSIADTCVTQMNVPNGEVSTHNNTNSSFNYELICNTGYQARGNTTSQCILGKLSTDLGWCEFVGSNQGSSLCRSYVILLPPFLFYFLL